MGKGSKLPYVRFYASDWLGGTRGMKAAEVGVYITLIALMYERCEPLPSDHKRLSRQCGCTPGAFKKILEMLAEDGKIDVTESGLWNKRVEKEFKFREENSQQSRKAASKRWKKDNKNNSDVMRAQCERNAVGMPKPEARSQKPERKGSAHAREANPEPVPIDPPADTSIDPLAIPRHLKPQCRLADRFVKLYEKHWPNESRLPPPTMGLEAEASTWLKTLAEGKIVETMDRQFERMATKGLSPPRSFRIISGDLQNAAARAKGTVDEGTAASIDRSRKSQEFGERRERETRWNMLSRLDSSVLTEAEADELMRLQAEFRPVEAASG